MDTIRVKESDPETFLKKLSRAVAGGELGAIAKFDLKENDFCIRFSGLGESKIWYKLEKEGDGFFATKKREKIALLHIAFRAEMEKNLAAILLRLGAEIS
ncbi:hypothetical protein EHQ27_11495 [Leptospira wolffii]|uniref:Uncharacterized protein n=1 Tax=Leptospira wolffii TaxID=409998 RepID=A0A2M9Z8H3_9LEPT|nr:hypothetical protein [Leptospira wolffii]EPG67144.1 hypothetical protein LEP1GSC061_1684 [Leptospira wolffii serovar Khorat str. Khorat-H2]PJZ64716.1 hypothetical protein CH371_16460 [Leptospira wolffii]TGK56992.1 hypothetical protein EHQ32_15575 [Leptospira wolffii]TGK71025.1 hypothetical protein EHQ27_11495 [Leptospira wolffii]TGK75716.1 hypothetical protein EHQ35_04945 [Leptospira wolffii]